MAHVPSHHDHKVGEWIGIRAQVDHVVTFNRESGAAAAPISASCARCPAPLEPASARDCLTGLLGCYRLTQAR